MPTRTRRFSGARIAAFLLGGWLVASSAAAVEADSARPRVSLAALTPWPARVTRTVPIAVTWAMGEPRVSSEVQARWNSGPWTAVQSDSACRTSLTLTAPLPTAGHARTVQFRVRPIGPASSQWAESGSVTITCMDESALTLRYTGQWQTSSRGTALGMWRAETRKGVVRLVTLDPFVSSGSLAWLATMGPDRGIAHVRIDDGPAIEVDLYAPVARGAVLAYVSAPLEAGVTHAVEIEVGGRHNPAATDSLVDMDGIVVLDGGAQPTQPSLGGALLGMMYAATGGEAVHRRAEANAPYEIHDDYEVIGGAPAAADSTWSDTHFALEAGAVRASPNPSRSTTRLLFMAPGNEQLRLIVLDAQGRVVRTLADGVFPAGVQSATWDGVDERGAHVPPGVYFAALRGRTRNVVQPLVRLP